MASVYRTVAYVTLLVVSSSQKVESEDKRSNEQCVDVIPNCAVYTKQACTIYNGTFARNNCRKFCNLCDQPTEKGINSTCADKLSHCDQYGRYACKDPYASWARINCAKFCGFCRSGLSSNGSSSIQGSNNSTCADKLPNCKEHGRYACIEPYAAWAKENCAKFCGLCTSGLPQVNRTVNHGLTSTACVDKLSNCEEYGTYACQGLYVSWARSNCPKFCGFCVSEQFNGSCVDSTLITCTDSHVCSDKNLKTYCPITCGLCVRTTTPPCLDSTFIKCSDSHICSDDVLKTYCPVTCGLCGSNLKVFGK